MSVDFNKNVIYFKKYLYKNNNNPNNGKDLRLAIKKPVSYLSFILFTCKFFLSANSLNQVLP